MKRNTFEKAVAASNLPAPSRQLLSYYAYKKHWANDGKVWPSNATIATETGLSDRTIRRHVTVLRDTGWLVPTGVLHGQGAVEYDLAIGNPGQSDLGTSVTVTAPETVTPVSVTDVEKSLPETTPVRESRSAATESRTPVTLTYKEVKNKIEEVNTVPVVPSGTPTPVPDGPVVEPSLNNEVRESVPSPNREDLGSEFENPQSASDNLESAFHKCWIFLKKSERTYFESAKKVHGASQTQFMEAVVLYQSGQVTGSGWYERAENALCKTGVEIETW